VLKPESQIIREQIIGFKLAFGYSLIPCKKKCDATDFCIDVYLFVGNCDQLLKVVQNKIPKIYSSIIRIIPYFP